MFGRLGCSALALLLGWVCHSAYAADAVAEASNMPAHSSFSMASAALGETRTINVYTPPGYAAHPHTRYAVLYMPDGGMQEDFPHVATDVDTAIRAGEMEPMIVVGIENTERRRDMTGPTHVASDRAIATHVGGSAAFRRFIAAELMPQVRRRLRTSGHDAIVGESLAGWFVLETFFAQPQLFDTYIAFSPSLWWNDESLSRNAAMRLQAWPGLARSLYVAPAADDGTEAAVARLRAALVATAPKGLRWFCEPMAHLHHSDIYRGASPGVFRRMFPPARTRDSGTQASRARIRLGR